tara:strand:+ start:227 stop:910 length:684 start_codon:yes stop_codon:yes gene_type:complete
MVLHATTDQGIVTPIICSVDGKLHVSQTNFTNYLKLSESAAIYADSLPVPTADPNGRPGWLYKKVAANTDKINYYYYAQGSHPITLGELSVLNCTVTVDAWTSVNSVPFMVIYTKPTGVGDAGAWYHSKRSYGMDASTKIMLGESINLYAVNVTDGTGTTLPGFSNNQKRYINLSVKTDTGDALDSEEILTISIHTDSASPLGTQILVENVGLEVADGRSTYFDLTV